MRFRHLFFLIGAVLLLTALALLSWLFTTNSGARWVLRQIPHLTVQKVQGDLAGNMRLSQLHWSNGTTRFSARNLRWDLHPTHLLWGTLDLGSLGLDQAQLHLPAPSSKPDRINLSWPALPLWTRFIGVHVGPMHINNLQAWQGATAALNVSVSTVKNISWQHGDLLIQTLHAEIPEGTLQVSAKLRMEKRELQSQGSWTQGKSPNKKMHINWQTDWVGTTENDFGGPLLLELKQGNSTSKITGIVHIAPRQIVFKSLKIQNPQLAKTAQGFWQIDLPSDSAGNFIMAVKMDRIEPKSMPKSLAAGALSLQLHLQGNLNHYQGLLAISGNQKWGDIHGNVSGTNQGLQFQYTGNLLGATLLPASLQIHWQPQLQVQGQIRVRNFHPQRVRADIPGNLSGDLTFKGAEVAKILSGNLALQILPSQIYQQKLQGQARLHFSGSNWDLEEADLHGPGVRLKASGNLQERLDVALRVANWRGLLPGAQGSSEAQGWVKQQNQNWSGKIQAHALGLAYKGIVVQELKAQASLLPQNQLQAHLQVQGIQYEKHRVNLQAQAVGTLDRFLLGLHAQWVDSHFTLEGLVSHSAQGWGLQLDHTQLQSQSLGHWQLVHAATLSWKNGVARVSPLLVTDAHGSKISVQGLFNPAANQASVDLGLISLPLDFHTHQYDTSIKGYLNAHIHGRCQGACTAEGQWDFQKTRLQWRSDEALHAVNLQLFTGQLHWLPNNLELSTNLQLPDHWGGAQVHLHSPVTLTLPWHWNSQAGLQASIHANIGAALLAQLPIGALKLRSQGEGSIQGAVSGTWAAPQWQGTAELKGLGMYVPQAGLDLQDVGAKLEGSGQDLRITDLQATSGAGTIMGNGLVHLQPDTHFTLQVTGHEFTALNLPQVQAAVSPDLNISGSLKKIMIGGSIHTNRLRILGTDFNGPKPSGDVVFVKNVQHARSGPALSVALKVTLGNDAKVLISGLRASLVGDLDVRMDDGKNPQVTGILHMVDGHYDIYGHTLDFERGSINFHGEASQANLDVLAVRSIKNSDSFAVDNTPVKAGVQVTGTLQVPQVTLYSSPSMSQADILSYLVLGTPSSSLGNQNELLSAAAGTLFSASRAALFGNSLSNTGIDVGVTSNGESGLSGAMVTLGHYLTPDLYLSVGQSVMGNGTVARLRYRISKHIELQTESGTQNGANLFYRIDF